MKKLIILIITCLITASISAQNLHIKGRVSSGEKSVEFANVILQTKDSVFVTGGVTDEHGRFAFTNLSAGDYRVKISSIGYRTQVVPLHSFSANRELNDIQLDSAPVALDEVEVKASCVVNQSDRKIYLPTAFQIKASTNGLDLLMQMKLNRLQVDPMNQKITSSNPGDVQIRINGNKADINEVRGLRPEAIQRVEYHEDPSLRYGDNVAVVIDYITKIRQSGGYLGIDTQNSPFEFFGNNGVNGKYNYKNSEIGFNYWGMYRSYDKYFRDKTETFNYNDGTQSIRQEKGDPSDLIENHHYLSLTYSYRQGEKWSFFSRFRQAFDESGMKTQSYLFPVNNPNNGVNMTDDSKSRKSSPTIDFYFQRNYPKKQKLMLNAVMTYGRSNKTRYYLENQSGVDITDITSKVKEDQYAFMGEGIYEKEFTLGKLSTGFNLYQEYDRDLYLGNIHATTNLHATYLNFYSEWSGKVKKLNYRVSVGGLQARYSQAEKKMEKLLPTTRIRLTYKLTDNMNLRWNGSLNYSAPALGDISNVTQIVDSLQINKGNPNLQETQRYKTNLMADFQKGLFSANLNIKYQYFKRPMMESIYLRNNLFVHSTDNQKSWQKVNPQLELKFGPIQDILNLSFSTGLNYYDSNGLTYHHTYTNWYYQIQATAMYKNWMAFFQMQNQEKSLYGETITSGEAYHLLMVRYKYKNLTVGVMSFNPFSGKNSYKRPSETLNKHITSKSCWYLSNLDYLCAITFSWNFSFGRKYKSVEKYVDQDRQADVKQLMNTNAAE